MPDIKVRVGQQNAIKVVASSFGGSLTAENAANATNVLGGIASVTQIINSGVTTLTGPVRLGSTLDVSGISTFSSLGVSGLTTTKDLIVTGIATIAGATISGGAFEQLQVTGVSTIGVTSATWLEAQQLNVTGVSTIGITSATWLEAQQLNVTGVSTFTGLVDGNAGANFSGAETTLSSATVSDLTDNRIVIAGTSGALEDTTKLTFDGSTLAVVGDATFSGNVSIAGTLTKEDVTNIDSVGLITARSGVRITDGGLVVTAGISTFGGRIVGAATSNVIPFLYSNFSDLPSASTYHGAFAHVHARGKGYFAHSSNWYELVNKEINGTIGVGTERYNIGPTNVTTLNISGVSTFVGVVTTSSDLYIGGDLYIKDDLTFDEFTAASGNITGILTTATANVTGTLTAGLIDGGSY